MREVFIQPVEVEWLEEDDNQEAEVASDQLKFPKLDGMVFPLAAEYADVVAPCKWMGGAEVTLTEALNNYYQTMTEDTAEQIVEDINEFLANQTAIIQNSQEIILEEIVIEEVRHDEEEDIRPPVEEIKSIKVKKEKLAPQVFKREVEAETEVAKTKEATVKAPIENVHESPVPMFTAETTYIEPVNNELPESRKGRSINIRQLAEEEIVPVRTQVNEFVADEVGAASRNQIAEFSPDDSEAMSRVEPETPNDGEVEPEDRLEGQLSREVASHHTVQLEEIKTNAVDHVPVTSKVRMEVPASQATTDSLRVESSVSITEELEFEEEPKVNEEVITSARGELTEYVPTTIDMEESVQVLDERKESSNLLIDKPEIPLQVQVTEPLMDELMEVSETKNFELSVSEDKVISKAEMEAEIPEDSDNEVEEWPEQGQVTDDLIGRELSSPEGIKPHVVDQAPAVSDNPTDILTEVSDVLSVEGSNLSSETLETQELTGTPNDLTWSPWGELIEDMTVMIERKVEQPRSYPITQVLDDINSPDAEETVSTDEILLAVENVQQLIKNIQQPVEIDEFINASENSSELEELNGSYIELFDSLVIEYDPRLVGVLSALTVELQIEDVYADIFKYLKDMDDQALSQVVRRRSGGSSGVVSSVKKTLSKIVIIGRSAMRLYLQFSE